MTPSLERIADTLKKLGNNPNFQRRYEQMSREVLNHPLVRAFLLEHRNEVTKEMIEKNMMVLYEFANQIQNCEGCSSLEECPNLMKGYYPKLNIRKGVIDIHYKPCTKKILEVEKRKNETLIKCLYVPKDIMNASFVNIDTSGHFPGRIEALSLAMEFVENYKPDGKQKGLYLYGKFGVGKSFLLGAIANELAEKKVPSMIIYFPELMRELKSSISDQTLNEKIENIKRQPVLMIDDIGAETMSSWARDEVLGPILQFRMQEYLPTFFTSNFSYDELEHHLTYSQRGEVEQMKARRILERIKFLTRPVLMDGPNRRV